MSRKWFDNKVPSNQNLYADNLLESYSKETIVKYTKHFESYEIHLAANDVLNLAVNTNLYLNEKQPWILIKEENNFSLVSNIIYNVLESTRIIGLLLLPILPDLASNINQQLGSVYEKDNLWNEQLVWGKLTHKSNLPVPTPIITKLEYE